MRISNDRGESRANPQSRVAEHRHQMPRGENKLSHHKCKAVHRRWAPPTNLPCPVGTCEITKPREHRQVWRRLNTHCGLPDGPQAWSEQLHYWEHSWALPGLDYEKKKRDTKMPEVWRNFVDRWVQHRGGKRNWFLDQACMSPSKFKLKSAGVAASTRWSWGTPGFAAHC